MRSDQVFWLIRVAFQGRPRQDANLRIAQAFGAIRASLVGPDELGFARSSPQERSVYPINPFDGALERLARQQAALQWRIAEAIAPTFKLDHAARAAQAAFQ